MKTTSVKNYNISFMEMYFRIISLLFWPIYWYKWIVITVENYNMILFTIYLCIDLVFIMLILIKMLVNRKETNRYDRYALITALTYITSLYSFMIHPVNTTLLYIKMVMCLLLIYVSWNLVKKDLNDNGVVGILSGILLLLLTYFY